MTKRMRVSTVCVSNMNRSMEGHHQLRGAGYEVSSFGTGAHVNLPGPDRKPIAFDFGTPYHSIFSSLSSSFPDKGLDHFRQLGVVEMLERNMALKEAPQKWQDRNLHTKHHFDLVITYEERVFDAVVDDMQRTWGVGETTVVVMLQTKDNHKAAGEGGALTLHLTRLVEEFFLSDPDWINRLDEIVSLFEQTHRKELTYAVICN